MNRGNISLKKVPIVKSCKAIFFSYFYMSKRACCVNLRASEMYENNLMMIRGLIETQRKSLNLYVIFAILPITVGLIIIVLGNVMGTDIIKTLTSIGGTFITSISGFSFKEYLDKKESICIYEKLKLNVEFNKNNEQEQSNIKNLIQSVLLKSL
jgi:hypothetical protein